MVPGIGYAFKCFLDTLGVIEDLKSPVAAGDIICPYTPKSIANI